jgi:acyl-CoA synthetase (AMP-forming)/AMP-acid ligase II
LAGIGERARATPEAIAMVEHPRSITFQQLDERQRRLAGVFRSSKVAVGDRIAVLSANRVELLEVTTGALRCGIIPVPINPLLTPPEISYLIEDSGARLMFTDRMGEDHPDLKRVITFGDAYERSLEEAKPTRLSDFARGRPMHYTSGTTGSPKGVWVKPYSSEQAAIASAKFRELWGIASEDLHLVCSPLAHSAPHRFSLRTLEAGGTVFLQKRFEAEETLAAIALFGITSTFMVPTHLERILALGRTTLMRYDVSSMRLLAHAGAPIREETKRSILDLFPWDAVWEFYGSTEGQATRISSAEWLDKPGSVGRALRGTQISILDENLSRLPRMEVGQVWVVAPGAERFEYWGDPDKTRRAWHGGAFTVGDVGYLDDDGYLFLTGRKDDTIITGGVNVYPQEIEAVLAEHPAVVEALVFGVEHDEWGQEVHAAVVAEAGMPLEPDLLRTWARERLAGYKCPRVIEVVKSLPRTATGKLKRQPPGGAGR